MAPRNKSSRKRPGARPAQARPQQRPDQQPRPRPLTASEEEIADDQEVRASQPAGRQPQPQRSTGPRSGGARPAGGEQALVRSVEMSLSPGGAAATGRRGARGAPSENVPAGIPLDRVPHFTRDLIRVAITGSAMIVLLVVAALVIIPRVVH